MKINIKLLCFTIALLFFATSCEKSEDWLESRKKIYTIEELSNTISLSSYKCGEELECEGKYVNIKGYIMGKNTSVSGFLLYDNDINSSKMIQIYNSGDIYGTISSKYSNLSDTVFVPIEVKGTIFGWDISGNGWCDKTFSINALEVSFK